MGSLSKSKEKMLARTQRIVLGSGAMAGERRKAKVTVTTIPNKVGNLVLFLV
jgi:hypothetical protein